MKNLQLFLFSLMFSFVSLNILAEEPVAEQPFSEAQLEQMLAPIALYPDSVLTHILIAATYPLEVIQAARWVEKHPDLDPASALQEVEDESWDPSVKALVAFPRILDRLSNDLNWTQNIGDAFLQDEQSVLASIQSLRHKADQAGNLNKMENVEVTHQDNSIIIEPAEREVVYVPYYDTRVVYGAWHWSHYPPVYWDWNWHRHHRYGHHYSSHHRLFSWHPRVHLSFNFFSSAFHWHNHHVVILDRSYYRSHHYRHNRHHYDGSYSRRWSHNPKHRRGVAYRTEYARQRYHSNRPSVAQTRVTRRQENLIRNDNSRRRVNHTTTQTSRVSERQTPTTRHQRLRNALNQERNTATVRGQRTERRQINSSANQSRQTTRNNREVTSRQNRQTAGQTSANRRERNQVISTQSPNRRVDRQTRSNSNTNSRNERSSNHQSRSKPKVYQQERKTVTPAKATQPRKQHQPPKVKSSERRVEKSRSQGRNRSNPRNDQPRRSGRER